MAYQDLLRSQKNAVFRIIKETGLIPAEFEWSVPPEPSSQTNLGDIFYTQWPKITHVPTGCYFSFGSSSVANHKFYIKYFPSSEKFAETQIETDGSWPKTIRFFEIWLEIVSREYIEPDLWSTTDNKALIAEELTEFENSSFSLDEQTRISKAIVELKSFLLSTRQYSSEQIQFIEERLNHLDESSKRLGRKDWITLAMGTLTNIIVGVALAPDAARELVRNAGLLLGWIVGSVHLLH